MVQWVKDPALSQQQLGSQLWLKVQSLAWELPHATGAAKKKEKRRGFRERFPFLSVSLMLMSENCLLATPTGHCQWRLLSQEL